MKKTILKAVSLFLVCVMLAACSRGQTSENVPALSTTVMDLQLGKTGQISVTNYTGVVEWKSSDDSIATVSATGVITTIAIGSVAITAELENGDTMTCVLDVEPGTSKVEEIKVSGIYSDMSDITVDYNTSPTVSLQAECMPLSPMEELAWSSSDESIATVEQTGLVTVRSNGIVEIRATALNGVSGSCIIRVKNVPANLQIPTPTTEQEEIPVIDDGTTSRFTSPVPVTSPSAKSSIIISDRNVFLEVGESFTLTYSVGNLSDTTVEWSSSDKAVAIVKDGRIVAIGQGRAVVSAITKDGAVASCSVAVGKDEISKLKSEVAESKAE